MTMQNRQLGSGYGVVDIKFLDKIPTQVEFENYGPNEYLLIKSEEKIQLIYIDDDNHVSEISLEKIAGLNAAVTYFPKQNFTELKDEEKIETLRCIQQYHLKAHGGNEFILFKDEKYQGLINNFPKEKIPLINEWINSDEANSKDITSIVNQHTLALILPDILVDIDVTRLSKILPDIMRNLSDEIKEFFSDQKILEKLNKRFLNSLKKSLRDDMPKLTDAKSLSLFLAKDNIDKINPRILAYLVPAILDLMDDHELTKASVAIAKQLSPKDFRALADENYFQLNLQTFDNDQVTVKNNQRTIAFYANNSSSHAYFRGKKWNLDHTHMHLEDNGKESEYKIYDSRAQREEVKNGMLKDPNQEVVGEIHTVYKRASKAGNLKYMAVGFILKIGKENDNFDKILQKVENLTELTEDKKLDILINYQKMFMPTFQKAQQNHSIFLHNWASLKSNTHGFRAGLQFNVVPETIEVSERQYDRFKELFGEMAVLTEEKVLEPIDRKADHRQPRM